jgi:phosphatidylethanolamine/phosphatidyl-N-methylethanolamine N-methyltransferase
VNATSSYTRQFVAWLKNPLDVASVCPSSDALTDLIATRPAIARAEVVVDLGPATGETSAAMLSKMRPDGRLLAIERNEDLVVGLQQIADHRLIAVHGDAADLQAELSHNSLAAPQVIVSGIPFSSLKPTDGRKIMQSIYQALCPGGQFLAYQLRSTVVEYAEPYFGKPEMVKWVWRNIPPLRVFVWKKQSDRLRIFTGGNDQRNARLRH